MDLQEIVLSAGKGEPAKAEEQTVSASELLRSVPDASSLLAEGRGIEKALPKLSAAKAKEAVIPLAARFSAIESSSYVGSGPEIFAALFDFLENNEQKDTLRQTVSRACNRLELAILLADREGCYSFLEYIWQDQLEQKLADFTGVSPQVAREWLGGKTPALYNQEMIFAATTILHQLCLECQMSPGQARHYFEEVRFGHSDDRRLRAKSLWEWIAVDGRWLHKKISFQDDLCDHIVSLGGDREVFCYHFRDRFLV